VSIPYQNVPLLLIYWSPFNNSLDTFFFQVVLPRVSEVTLLDLYSNHMLVFPFRQMFQFPKDHNKRTFRLHLHTIPQMLNVKQRS